MKLEELADLHEDLLDILRRPGVLLATGRAGDLRQTARVCITAIGDGEDLHRIAGIFTGSGDRCDKLVNVQ